MFGQLTTAELHLRAVVVEDEFVPGRAKKQLVANCISYRYDFQRRARDESLVEGLHEVFICSQYAASLVEDLERTILTGLHPREDCVCVSPALEYFSCLQTAQPSWHFLPPRKV